MRDKGGNKLTNSKMIYGATFTAECITFLKKLKRGGAGRFFGPQTVSVKIRCGDIFLKLLNEPFPKYFLESTVP